MTDLERHAHSERRFGRLHAYEQGLHYFSLIVRGIASLGGMFPGRGLFLGGLAACSLLRALWTRVVDEEKRQHVLVMTEQWEEDEEKRQHVLVMTEQWEELERLLGSPSDP